MKTSIMIERGVFCLENYNRQQMYNNRNRMRMNSGSYASYGCNGRECSQNTDRTLAENMALAMAYVPWQEWKQVYEPCQALEAGTIFPELNLPFLGRSVWKR